MIMTYSESFENYSEKAIKQVLDQAVGKPVNDEHGVRIGTIHKATRVDKTKTIKFEAVVTGVIL